MIGTIFLMANILVVANWIAEPGIAEKAGWLRREFLTGTAIAVTLALLVLLVSPKSVTSKTIGFIRRCSKLPTHRHCETKVTVGNNRRSSIKLTEAFGVGQETTTFYFGTAGTRPYFIFL